MHGLLVLTPLGQGFQIRDEVEPLRDAEAVGVARHHRQAVRPGVSGLVDDDGVRKQDRLGDVFRRVHAPHPRQLRAEVLAVGRRRELFGLDLVALVALQLTEQLTPARHVARGDGELPATRHPAVAVQLFLADPPGRARRRSAGRRRDSGRRRVDVPGRRLRQARDRPASTGRSRR